MSNLDLIRQLGDELAATWPSRLAALEQSGAPLNALMEENIYGLWIGKQTAKGTPNTAPAKRLVQVGGDLNLARDDGSERYSDLSKYGAQADWVNSISGSGAPVCEATPTELAYLLWLMHGAETVTAEVLATGPPAVPAMSRHRFVPSQGIGFYATAFARVGTSVIRRDQFNDCLITKIAIECSSANKAARVTPSILSLDPAQKYAADPAAALPTDRPFLWTDYGQAGAVAAPTIDGSLTVDGVVFRGVTQFILTIDDAWSPVYGDSTQAYDFTQGSASVTVGATMFLDAAGWAQFNRLAYGTATPAAGTRPIQGVPALGSFVGLMRQHDYSGAHMGRELAATVPGVKWTLPDAPGPNPAGGVPELALAGSMRPVAGQQPYTVDVHTDPAVVAFTV